MTEDALLPFCLLSIGRFIHCFSEVMKFCLWVYWRVTHRGENAPETVKTFHNYVRNGSKTVFKVLYRINHIAKFTNYIRHAPRDEAGWDFTL